MSTELSLEPLNSSDPLPRGELHRLVLGNASASYLQQQVVLRARYSWTRRIADVAMVLLVSPAALVILAVSAIAVVIFMGSPVLFVQDRIGRNGRKFRMLKLRTMTVTPVVKSIATAPNDSRITPLGAFFRRFHLDELPQLWNILVGDMSFIGPRPEQPDLVAHYRALIPHYDLRHLVTPGLTGWAQVCFGYAADVHETRTKLEYDLYYVQNFGLGLDLRVVARTILVYANPVYVR